MASTQLTAYPQHQPVPTFAADNHSTRYPTYPHLHNLNPFSALAPMWPPRVALMLSHFNFIHTAHRPFYSYLTYYQKQPKI